MFHLNSKIKNNEVYVIAEMSANHAGKLENALKIVREAARIGADCLKIQTYTADSITINSHNKYFQIHGGLWDGYYLYDLYKEAGTPYEWHKAIKEECEKYGIDFLSTPFDKNAVDFLEELGVEAYKIASFEIVDIPLIEYAASKGKPMIISCGMATKEEIQDAVDACKKVGNNNIVLLKCCSDYPANWPDMHIANIRDMKDTFGIPVGLSDHSMGTLASVIAISNGACVIEKHICLSRKIKNPDSGFSMEVEEFEQLVKDCKAVNTIIGVIKYGPSKNEVKNHSLRRSIFAVADIKKGEVFTESNIRSIRPGEGIPPKYLYCLLGKKAPRDISFGEPITFEILESTK